MKLNEKHVIVGPASMPIISQKPGPNFGKVTGVEGEHACHGAGCNKKAGYTVDVTDVAGTHRNKLCKGCIDPSAFGAKKKVTTDVIHRNKDTETERGRGTPELQQTGASAGQKMFDVSRGGKAVLRRGLSRLKVGPTHTDRARFGGILGGRRTTDFSSIKKGNTGTASTPGVALKKTILKSSIDDISSSLNRIVEFLKTSMTEAFYAGSNKELNPMFRDDVNIDEEAVEKTANELIKESLFTAGPDNKLKNDTDVSGFDTKDMLAGEFFGSAAFSTQAPKEGSMFAPVNTIMTGQATDGEGARTSKPPELLRGARHEVVESLVEDLLEGSPAYLYNPDSVGYLLNELQTSGYDSFVSVIEGILDNPKESDAVTLDGISQELKAMKESDFLVEGVKALAVTLFEATDANAEPPQTQATTINQSEDSTDEETEQDTKLDSKV